MTVITTGDQTAVTINEIVKRKVEALIKSEVVVSGELLDVLRKIVPWRLFSLNSIAFFK